MFLLSHYIPHMLYSFIVTFLHLSYNFMFENQTLSHPVSLSYCISAFSVYLFIHKDHFAPAVNLSFTLYPFIHLPFLISTPLHLTYTHLPGPSLAIYPHCPISSSSSSDPFPCLISLNLHFSFTLSSSIVLNSMKVPPKKTCWLCLLIILDC